MSIPAIISQSIAQFSDRNDFESPELVDRAEINHEERVCLVLMSDTLGRAQVVFPADRIVNLDTLNRVMGRELRVIKQSDLQSLLDRYALRAIPAIPDITGIPTIVDASVRENDSDYAYLDVGEPDQLLKIKRSLFNEMLTKAQQNSFTRRISEIKPHKEAEKDQEEIAQAIEKFTSLRIKQRIEDTLELPPLPQSAQDIIRLRADPDASSDDLSTIVEKDPSLAAQVVSWAASSFYSAPGNVRSVHDAVIRVLGFDLVMNLSMGLSLGKTLNLPENEPEGFTPYWQKALWMALGTTALISKIEPSYRPSFGMAYLSGLLHNFGYLVLAHVFPPHHALICRYREANPHVDPSLIEAYCLDITSEQVGATLMNVWSLPEQVVSAIRHQKNPEFGGEFCQYAKILHLTQYMLGKLGIIPQTINTPPTETFEYFGISEETATNALMPLVETPEEVIGMAKMMKG